MLRCAIPSPGLDDCPRLAQQACRFFESSHSLRDPYSNLHGVGGTFENGLRILCLQGSFRAIFEHLDADNSGRLEMSEVGTCWDVQASTAHLLQVFGHILQAKEVVWAVLPWRNSCVKAEGVDKKLEVKCKSDPTGSENKEEASLNVHAMTLVFCWQAGVSLSHFFPAG